MSDKAKDTISIIFKIFVIVFIVGSVILLMSDENMTKVTKENNNNLIKEEIKTKDKMKYNYSDQLRPSQQPPGGLSPEEVPQFITFGFDDNAYSGLEGSGGDGGMKWIIDLLNNKNNPAGRGNSATFDGESLKASFYVNTLFIEKWMSESPVLVKRMWREIYETGHEIGLHSHSHPHGRQYSLNKWKKEFDTNLEWLLLDYDPNESVSTPDKTKGPGIPLETIIGWRTPHLEYNNNVFLNIKLHNLVYDCSIEEGWQNNEDGTNYYWPYTLNYKSPGNTYLTGRGTVPKVEKHSGVWEIPVYTLIVPPDEKCKEYGIEPGLQDKMAAKININKKIDKVVGFDYNVWIDYDLSKDEFLAILKYSLDLRLKGNKAPFNLGAHSDYYDSKYPYKLSTNYKERQLAIEEFINYALSKPDVRFVSNKQLIQWLRNPEAL